jgi:hypothetical protein
MPIFANDKIRRSVNCSANSRPVLWSEAQTHIGENIGNADARIMAETK